MTANAYGALIATLAEKKAILPENVLSLRRHVYTDGLCSASEAESLFRLNETCHERCAEWSDFLIEAVSDFVVLQERPRGHVSQAKADWLVGAISHDGVVDSLTELELLVAILEKAKSSPETLSAYALGQIAIGVIEGEGPLADGGALTPGVINAAEVDLVRRILFAFGGDGNVAVSRAEAEMLLRMNRQTSEARNDPSWNELFIKSIANFVLAASGYEPPSRQEALRHEAFLESTDTDIGGFFGRMLIGGLAGIMSAYEKSSDVEDAWAERNAARESTFAKVDTDEVRWLVENFGDGRPLHDNERALLGFIKQHARGVHPDLEPLLGNVA